MSVYVGVPMWPFGRMVMCHMVADSEEELNLMANNLGLSQSWKQHDPDKKPGTMGALVHFDISKSKRAEAIKLGAVALDTIEAEACVLDRVATGRHGKTGRKHANSY